MQLVIFRRVFFIFLYSFVAGVPVVEVHQKEADLDDLANSSFSDSLLDDEQFFLFLKICLLKRWRELLFAHFLLFPCKFNFVVLIIIKLHLKKKESLILKSILINYQLSLRHILKRIYYQLIIKMRSFMQENHMICLFNLIVFFD